MNFIDNFTAGIPQHDDITLMMLKVEEKIPIEKINRDFDQENEAVSVE